jgi:hypothetical protein
MWQRLWTFKTRNFSIELAAMPEQDPDLSWDDTGEVVAKLESGEWENVTFRVAVYGPHGEQLGADYLGNSIYGNLMDFRREHIGARGKWGSYFRDMVGEAISEARDQVRDLQGLRLRSAVAA